MADAPNKFKVQGDRALTLEEAEKILIQAGVPLDFITSAADLGKHISAKGDVEFQMGIIIEEIQVIKQAHKDCNELLKVALNEKVKADLLGQISKLSTALTMAVRELSRLQAMNMERRKNDKPKARSFAPDQQISAIQIDSPELKKDQNE